jgi:hypothetical protein
MSSASEVTGSATADEELHFLQVGGMDLISLLAIVVGAVVRHDPDPDGQRVTGADSRYRQGEREVGVDVVVRDVDPGPPHRVI